MTVAEEKLVLLVKLHYADDRRSFDALVRNLVGRRGVLTPEAQIKLRDVVPDQVRMGQRPALGSRA